MPHLDEKLSSGNYHWEKAPLDSEGLEVVCAECSETAPIALPSDRGLHVCNSPAQRSPEHAPQVCEKSSPLYSVGDPGTPDPATAAVTNGTDATNSPSEEPLSESTDQRSEKPRGAPLICGLRRRTFWGVAILLLIVVAGAAIGGGVGGVYAKRSQSTSSVPTASSSSSSSIINSSAPSSPTTTTGPKSHNAFSLQIWSLPSFTGRTQIFYSPGSFQTAFFARSYIWSPGQYDLETKSFCSVAQCLGSNQVGWRGSSAKEQPGYPQNETWRFDNVVIECMASFSAPSCPTPVALSTFDTVPVVESPTSNVSVDSATLESGRATGRESVTGTGTDILKSSSPTSSATMTTGL
jgi:hypothetical protein